MGQFQIKVENHQLQEDIEHDLTALQMLLRRYKMKALINLMSHTMHQGQPVVIHMRQVSKM